MKASAYYNCVGAPDKEIADEAKFLKTICPPFVLLPRLFEIVWRRRKLWEGRAGRNADIAETRLAAIREVRNILEVVNTAAYPNV